MASLAFLVDMEGTAEYWFSEMFSELCDGFGIEELEDDDEEAEFDGEV